MEMLMVTDERAFDLPGNLYSAYDNCDLVYGNAWLPYIGASIDEDLLVAVIALKYGEMVDVECIAERKLRPYFDVPYEEDVFIELGYREILWAGFENDNGVHVLIVVNNESRKLLSEVSYGN